MAGIPLEGNYFHSYTLKPAKEENTHEKQVTPDQKITIVLESINTHISMADLCRKHNVAPQTFSTWKKKFIESGKNGLRTRRSDALAIRKEVENCKRIIGEYALANDVLKKTLEEHKD